MPSLLFRDYLARVNADRTYLVGLLTVDTGSAVLRFNSTDDREILSRGETYFRAAFDYRIPDRVSEGEQRSGIVLPVANRVILEDMRANPEEVEIDLEIVCSRTPDVVELGPFHMRDVSRAFDAQSQTLLVECGYRNVLRDPRPRLRFTPTLAPALFALSNLEGVS